MKTNTSGVTTPADNSNVMYPEVFHGATEWVYGDQDPHQVVTVTAHGLRRLLRFVADVQAEDFDRVARGEIPKGEKDRDQLTKRMNQGSTIFCEGDLVVSRLFVDGDGREIRHPDDEVDAAALDFLMGKGRAG